MTHINEHLYATHFQKMKIIIILLSCLAAITHATSLIAYQDSALLTSGTSIRKYSLSDHSYQGTINTNYDVENLLFYAFNSNYSKLYAGIQGEDLVEIDLSTGTNSVISQDHSIFGVVASDSSVFELTSHYNNVSRITQTIIRKHDFNNLNANPTEYVFNEDMNFYANALDKQNNLIYMARLGTENGTVVIFDISAGTFSKTAVDDYIVVIIPTASGFVGLTQDFHYVVYTRSGQTITRSASLLIQHLYFQANFGTDRETGKIYYFPFVNYRELQTISDQGAQVVQIDPATGTTVSGFPIDLPHSSYTSNINVTGANFFSISNNIVVYYQLLNSQLSSVSFYNIETQGFAEIQLNGAPTTSSPPTTPIPVTSAPTTTRSPHPPISCGTVIYGNADLNTYDSNNGAHCETKNQYNLFNTKYYDINFYATLVAIPINSLQNSSFSKAYFYVKGTSCASNVVVYATGGTGEVHERTPGNDSGEYCRYVTPYGWSPVDLGSKNVSSSCVSQPFDVTDLVLHGLAHNDVQLVLLLSSYADISNSSSSLTMNGHHAGDSGYYLGFEVSGCGSSSAPSTTQPPSPSSTATATQTSLPFTTSTTAVPSSSTTTAAPSQNLSGDNNARDASNATVAGISMILVLIALMLST
jgi:hypothetical protein